jgi:hypothetical protein
VEIEVSYEGTIVQDATRLTQIGVPEEIAKHTSWDQIGAAFTAVRGAGYVAWYPIATEAADFSEGNSMFQVADRWRAREANAIMKLAFDITSGANDASVILFCNGASISTEPRGSATQPHATSCEYSPLRTATPTFVSGRLAWKAGGAGESPLGFYVLGGHDVGVETYLAGVEPATRFVNDWFGESRARINIVDLADESAAPFESGNMLLAPLGAIDKKLVEINLIHMIAPRSTS